MNNKKEEQTKKDTDQTEQTIEQAWNKIKTWYKKNQETAEEQKQLDIRGNRIWYQIYIILEILLIILIVYVWLSGYACKYHCTFIQTPEGIKTAINLTHIGGLP